MTDTPKNPGDALAPCPFCGGNIRLKEVDEPQIYYECEGACGCDFNFYVDRDMMNNRAALTPSPDYVMVPREPTREMIKSAWTAQYLNIGADMAMAENLAEIRVNDTKQKSQDQLAYEAMIAPYVNGEKK